MAPFDVRDVPSRAGRVSSAESPLRLASPIVPSEGQLRAAPRMIYTEAMSRARKLLALLLLLILPLHAAVAVVSAVMCAPEEHSQAIRVHGHDHGARDGAHHHDGSGDHGGSASHSDAHHLFCQTPSAGMPVSLIAVRSSALPALNSSFAPLSECFVPERLLRPPLS